MKYPLMPGQTVEYLVLHALESNMVDAWGIRKHLLLQGPDYMLRPRQISGALQRLKRDGIVKHLNEGERDRWSLVHNASYTSILTPKMPPCFGRVNTHGDCEKHKR